MGQIVRTETRKRGPVGWIFLILFWGFNALMLVAFIAGMQDASDTASTLTSEAERTGAAIGTVLGASMLVGFWAMGAIILGLFVLFTRGKKIIVETTGK